MTYWRNINSVWCVWPSRPSILVEMIGGSYLASTPHISYRNLLECLSNQNIAIHAWSYLPGLDHQDNFHERTEFCLQMAKKYGYIGMTRLHISAWNQTTGV